MATDQKAEALKTLGIVAVAKDSEPAPPVSRDRDEARWTLLADYLPEHPGTFYVAKVYDNLAGAGVAMSNINNDKNKRFPTTNYEARSDKDKDKNTSTLYLRFTPTKA